MTASQHHHGLTEKQVRQLAFEFAKQSNCTNPKLQKSSAIETDEGEQQELTKALQSDNDDCISDDGIKDCLLDDAPITASRLNPGDYILVAVHGKKSTQHFVVHVTEVFLMKKFCEVDFMIKNGKNSVSSVKDSSTVDMSDVRLILPPPAICGGTNRTAKNMTHHHPRLLLTNCSAS